MKKASKQLHLTFIIIIVFATVLTLTTEGKQFWACVAHLLQSENRDTVADRYDFNIHFMDVGKADSALIENNGKFILIDGGNINNTDFISSYLIRRGVRELDAVILTHPDIDHFGSFIKLLGKLPTKAFYTVNAPHAAEEYTELKNVLANKNIITNYLKVGDKLNFGDTDLHVLSPVYAFEETNDMSLVISVTYKEFTALLTGDISTDAEEVLLERPELLSADLLKVAHHGSDSSSSEKFLEAVKPSVAVISVGADKNSLPKPEIIERLMNLNITAYRTDIHGTVIVSTMGDAKINISTKEEEYEIVNN